MLACQRVSPCSGTCGIDVWPSRVSAFNAPFFDSLLLKRHIVLKGFWIANKGQNMFGWFWKAWKPIALKPNTTIVWIHCVLLSRTSTKFCAGWFLWNGKGLYLHMTMYSNILIHNVFNKQKMWIVISKVCPAANNPSSSFHGHPHKKIAEINLCPKFW